MKPHCILTMPRLTRRASGGPFPAFKEGDRGGSILLGYSHPIKIGKPQSIRLLD
jgi:hypothetical protein